MHCTLLLSQDDLRLLNRRGFGWDQVVREAVGALREVPLDHLRRWSRNGLAVAANAVVFRFNSVLRLCECAAKGAWGEFKALWGAMWEGRLGDFLMDRCREAWALFRSINGWIRRQLGELAAFGKKLGEMGSA